MDILRILLTNSGRRTYMVENLIQSATLRQIAVDIHVTDTSLDTASFWVNQSIIHHITPRVSENPLAYQNEIIKICKQGSIDLLIPLMDYELPLLADIKEDLLKLGTVVVVSIREVVDMCLDKVKMYEYCCQNNILTPQIYDSNSSITFPVIYKKRFGSGSVGLKILNHKSELKDHKDEDEIYQQYIKGQEYGLDIFNDFKGNFQYCSIRKKLSMRAGETDKAEVFHDEKIWNYGKTLGSTIGHVGNMDADIILDDEGLIYLIDLNPRFGGGYPFSFFSGVDGIGAILDMYMGKSVHNEFDKSKRYVVYKGINVFGREV